MYVGGFSWYSAKNTDFMHCNSIKNNTGTPCQAYRLLLILKQFLTLQVHLVSSIFRLDALAKALSVIAMATWLGGWVAGCHTPVLYQNR